MISERERKKEKLNGISESNKITTIQNKQRDERSYIRSISELEEKKFQLILLNMKKLNMINI